MTRKTSKRGILFIAGVLVLFGGLAANFIFNGESNDNQSQQTNQSEQAPVDSQAVTVDPCVLFSEADIERIFEAQFEVGLAQESQQKTLDDKQIIGCEYRQANDGTESGLKNSYTLHVIIENYNLAENAESQKSSRPSKSTKNTVTIDVVKGSQLYRISVSKDTGIDSTKDQERLNELVQTRF